MMLHSQLNACPLAQGKPVPSGTLPFLPVVSHPSPVTCSAATSSELAVAARAQERRPRRRGEAMRLPSPTTEINWTRWEISMCRKAEEHEARRVTEATVQAQPADEYDLQGGPTSSSGSGNEAYAAVSEAYFRRYDNPAAQMPLLQDGILLRTWQAALEQLGPSRIQGKVVLDLGCGPGVLAMLCAQQGAEHVVAVDGSASMAEAAEQVVEANNLSDKITVIHADVESSSFNLAQKVDVIVSNWAGPGLLGGGMLRALSRARRDFLKPGGLVLPSRAELFVSGIEDRDSLAAAKAAWDVPVAGFSVAPAMVQVVRQPRIDTLKRVSQVATTTASVLHLQPAFLGVQTAAQGFQALPFTLTASRDERLFGLVLHFDLGFGAGPLEHHSEKGSGGVGDEVSGAASSSNTSSEAALFTTDPRAPPTHYQQLVLNFPRAVRVLKGDMLEGTLGLKPLGLRGSDLELSVELSFQGTTASTSYTLVHGAAT